MHLKVKIFDWLQQKSNEYCLFFNLHKQNHPLLVILKPFWQCRIDWTQLFAPHGTNCNIVHKSLLDFQRMCAGQITVDYLIDIFAQIT